MKPVIELIRVSSRGQADDDRGGIPAQRAANRRTAEHYGLEIVETDELIDVSGAAVLLDARFLRFLENIGRPDIHGVVTREFSRLMRPENLADFAILQRFKETNTILYLPDGPIDFTSKSGRLMGTIRAAIAGEERETIRERMMDAKEELRRMGRWVAGKHQLPYAVDYDQTTYKYSYKPEAEKVREVFHRFLSGDQNYAALSEFLGLSRGAAKNILQHPIYTGWLVYREKRDPSNRGLIYGPDGKPKRDRRRIGRSEEETYRHRVIEPGLVSDEEFARVQEITAKKQELNLRQRSKTGEFTYNGFLWCAKCGARIHTVKNQFDGYYYFCSHKKARNVAGEPLCPDTRYMNRDRAESVLDDLLSRTLTNPDLLRQIYENYIRRIDRTSEKQDRERVVERYKALHEKRRRLIDLAGDGLISKEECAKRLKEVDTQIRGLHEKLIEASPAPGWNPAQLVEIFAPFTSWSSLDRNGKRRMLSGLLAKFYITDYQISGVHLGAVSQSLQPVHADIDRLSRCMAGRAL